MELNIKLGEKSPESPCCAPSPSEKTRVWYPELYISHKSPLEVPKEGTMVIRYKKVSSSEREDSYSCTLEVHEIVSAEGEEDNSPSKRDRSTDNALDALVEKKMKERGY